MNALGKAAIRALHQGQNRVFGVAITYGRGNVSHTVRDVVLGRHANEIQDVLGVVEATHFDRDFLILITAFPFDDGPQRNDWIEYEGKRYQVLAPLADGRHYRSDMLDVRYRVSTKLVNHVSP